MPPSIDGVLGASLTSRTLCLHLTHEPFISRTASGCKGPGDAQMSLLGVQTELTFFVTAKRRDVVRLAGEWVNALDAEIVTRFL